MKITIEHRKAQCVNCGISAIISAIGSPNERMRWMSLPPGWFASPTSGYLCIGCSLQLCGDDAKSLPTDLFVLDRLKNIEEKLSELSGNVKKGSVSVSRNNDYQLSQGIRDNGSPWCVRCPNGTCEGLAVLAECDIRKGVPLPGEYANILEKTGKKGEP